MNEKDYEYIKEHMDDYIFDTKQDANHFIYEYIMEKAADGNPVSNVKVKEINNGYKIIEIAY